MNKIFISRLEDGLLSANDSHSVTKTHQLISAHQRGTVRQLSAGQGSERIQAGQ